MAASRKNITFNIELINKVKEYYLLNDTSFAKLALNSKELFGVTLTKTQIIDMSDKDPDGAWDKIKKEVVAEESLDLMDELLVIKQKLFKQIQDDKYSSNLSQNVTAYMKVVGDLKLKLGTSDTRSDLQKVIEALKGDQ